MRGARPEAEIGHKAVLESKGEMTVVWTKTMPKVSLTPGWGAFPVPMGIRAQPELLLGLQTHPYKKISLMGFTEK